MAIGTPVLVDSGVSSASTNDPTVVPLGAGFPPAIDDVLVCFMRSTRGSSSMSGTPSLAHAAFSGGFTLQASRVVVDGINRSKISVFTGKADGTTSDKIDTLTGETANNTSRMLFAVRIPGAHLTTPMPSGQVATDADPDTADGNIAPSLPVAPAAGSITLAAIGINDAALTEPTVPSGWTKLGTFLTDTGPSGGFLLAYKLPGEQAAAFTGAATGGTDISALIIEIQEEPASGGGIVVKVLQAHGG